MNLSNYMVDLCFLMSVSLLNQKALQAQSNPPSNTADSATLEVQKTLLLSVGGHWKDRLYNASFLLSHYTQFCQSDVLHLEDFKF